MAKVKLLPGITGLKGKVGSLVYRNSKSGEIIVSKSPNMSKVEWSTAQVDYRQRFKPANAYAKAVMADPVARTAEQNRKTFRITVSDYFKRIDLLSGN